MEVGGVYGSLHLRIGMDCVIRHLSGRKPGSGNAVSKGGLLYSLKEAVACGRQLPSEWLGHGLPRGCKFIANGLERAIRTAIMYLSLKQHMRNIIIKFKRSHGICRKSCKRNMLKYH